MSSSREKRSSGKSGGVAAWRVSNIIKQ